MLFWEEMLGITQTTGDLKTKYKVKVRCAGRENFLGEFFEKIDVVGILVVV